MKIHKYTPCVLLVVLVFVVLVSCVDKNINGELSANDAIKIATNEAIRNKFDTSNSEIEILKVKGKYERGPLRYLSVMRFIPKEKRKELLTNEYWIVFFYPKGQLENTMSLGGEFYVLVDLHSGKILESFSGL